MQSVNMQSVFEYVIKKINDAPIIETPYKHIMISDIFPDEFYDTLLDHIPSTSTYTLKPKYGGKQTMTLNDFDILDDEKKLFWEQIYAFLRSGDFANILLKKFNVSKNGVSDLFLHKDLENFEIRPHCDVFSKLITYMFYLPKDSSLPQLGTQMLVPNDGYVKASGEDERKHQDWENFTTVKIAEYIPNSFFAFAPNENSFHAIKVNFPENSTKERDTIRGFVFDKDAKDYPEYLFGK